MLRPKFYLGSGSELGGREEATCHMGHRDSGGELYLLSFLGDNQQVRDPISIEVWHLE